MEAYQERVLVERAELAARLDKLIAFLQSPMPDQTTDAQQEEFRLLRLQHSTMRIYLDILDMRIEGWKLNG